MGFINPVSQPFCGDCNRLRLTAEGKIRNCLFSTEEWDARALLRSGASEPALQNLIRDCVAAKRAGHGIDDPDFVRPAARDVPDRRVTIMKYARAYLDNAATSWPKPPASTKRATISPQPGRLRRSRHAPRSAAGQTHRGSNAVEAAAAVSHAQDDPVVFCFNGTDALNLCIHGSCAKVTMSSPPSPITIRCCGRCGNWSKPNRCRGFGGLRSSADASRGSDRALSDPRRDSS